MTTIDDVIGESNGRSRAVLDYSQTTKRLVTAAKQPGFSVDSWGPLADLIAVDDFVRIGPFKDEMKWPAYTEFLTGWAMSSEWDCSFKRITETPEAVFLELEERSQIGDFSRVVNSVSVYEFNADNKITFVAVYLQMQLPDGSLPNLDAIGAAE